MHAVASRKRAKEERQNHANSCNLHSVQIYRRDTASSSGESGSVKTATAKAAQQMIQEMVT
jgi:ABC-type dipeptide/oligopeptide/nickel transport system ATPase component